MHRNRVDFDNHFAHPIDVLECLTKLYFPRFSSVKKKMSLIRICSNMVLDIKDQRVGDNKCGSNHCFCCSTELANVSEGIFKFGTDGA